MAEKFEESERYKYIMENIHDIVWELDAKLNFIFVSPNSKTISGYEADEMIGRNMLEFLTQESKEYILDSVKERREERINGTLKRPFLYDVYFINKDGTTRRVEVSAKPLFIEEQFVGYIGTSRDISEKIDHETEMKKYIEELEQTNRKLDMLATIDILTGVSNRRMFEQDVTIAAEKKEKYGVPFAIIMFDMDGFKQINDHYGHKMGDVILQEIATVAKGVLRASDKLFRWGGDEFIILLQETSIKNAFKVAEELRIAIEDYEFEIENDNLTISLGVGEYMKGESIDQFLSYVDNALFKAKAKGKNRTEYRS